jgi:putative transposase
LSDRFYGYRRIAEQLKREGLVVNSKRVRRLMRLDNLLSLRYKPFVPRTTDSAHGYEIVCDLTREAMLTAPDHVWVADITYIRLAEEFIYLAVVMDAFSRKIVGWALADHLQASLPLEASPPLPPIAPSPSSLAPPPSSKRPSISSPFRSPVPSRTITKPACLSKINALRFAKVRSSG